MDANLVRCLAFAGHFEEARAVAKGHLGVEVWNTWYVAMAVDRPAIKRKTAIATRTSLFICALLWFLSHNVI